jgi:hypothetical protein
LEHRVRNIHRSAHCKIDQCTCGAVHLTVGSTTVRLTEGIARELRDSLVQAIGAIDRARTNAPPPIALVTNPDDDPKVH